MNPIAAGRRSLAREFARHDVETLFIESACDDEKIIEENVRSVKISSPDYVSQGKTSLNCETQHRNIPSKLAVCCSTEMPYDAVSDVCMLTPKRARWDGSPKRLSSTT